MRKEKGRPAFRWIIAILLVWFILPKLFGAFLFSCLLITHQITFHGLVHDSRLPLTYALLFDYSPRSLLYYTPAAGFTSGILIAVNPHQSSSRPGILLHELRHVMQLTVSGPTEIYSSWNQLHLLLGYPYWETYLSNPFERDAYKFSGEQTKYNELLDQHAPRLSSLKMK